MIDTIGVHLAATVKDVIPPGWIKEFWKEGIQDNKGKMMVLPSGRLRHLATGLRVGVSGGEARWAEGELSCLVFKHNGILIKSQQELDQAIAVFLERVSEVCTHSPPYNLRRIDLVGHAGISPEMLVRVYKNFRLPRIRRDPIHYPGESLLWRGSKRKCRLYDKRLRNSGRPGDMTRIEWELHGSTITTEFGKVTTLDHLSIEVCYAVFHRLCRGFTPRCLAQKGNLSTILAMANAEKWCFGKIPLAEHLKGWRNPKVFQRLQQRAAVTELDLLKIDLQAYFPEDFSSYRPEDVDEAFKNGKA